MRGIGLGICALCCSIVAANPKPYGMADEAYHIVGPVGFILLCMALIFTLTGI